MLDLMIPMIMTIRLKMIMNKSKEPALAGSFVYVGMKDVKPHIKEIYGYYFLAIVLRRRI